MVRDGMLAGVSDQLMSERVKSPQPLIAVHLSLITLILASIATAPSLITRSGLISISATCGKSEMNCANRKTRSITASRSAGADPRKPRSRFPANVASINLLGFGARQRRESKRHIALAFHFHAARTEHDQRPELLIAYRADDHFLPGAQHRLDRHTVDARFWHCALRIRHDAFESRPH